MFPVSEVMASCSGLFVFREPVRCDPVAGVQGCKSTGLWGFQKTRFGHRLLTKSKDRGGTGGEKRKEFIPVRLTPGR